MTAPRQVIANRTYLLSRRCTQRQHLLRPDPEIEQAFEYCLAEAAMRFNIALHAWIAMSNHEHIIFTDNEGNYPEFLAHLHKMIAKVVNAFRGRFENLWSTEQPNAVWLVNPEDRFDKLIYLLTNAVKDDLVAHAIEWPGASSIGLHLRGRTTKTVMRPDWFFREDGKMPAIVTLTLARLPGFEDLSENEWRDKIAAAVAEAEAEAQRVRAATGRRVFGRRNVLRVKPTASPTSIEPRRKLRPHLACRDAQTRERELAVLQMFRCAYRDALKQLSDGTPGVVFPSGTYLLVRFRGAFMARSSVPLAA